MCRSKLKIKRSTLTTSIFSRQACSLSRKQPTNRQQADVPLEPDELLQSRVRQWLQGQPASHLRATQRLISAFPNGPSNDKVDVIVSLSPSAGQCKHIVPTFANSPHHLGTTQPNVITTPLSTTFACYLPEDDPLFFTINIPLESYVSDLLRAIRMELLSNGQDIKPKDIRLFKVNLLFL